MHTHHKVLSSKRTDFNQKDDRLTAARSASEKTKLKEVESEELTVACMCLIFLTVLSLFRVQRLQWSILLPHYLRNSYYFFRCFIFTQVSKKD